MASLTMFETTQIIATQLQLSSLGLMELIVNENELFSTLNCNFKSYNNTHSTLHAGSYYKPKSYKNNIMAKQCLIKQLSFMIASYIVLPNSSFETKLIKCLLQSKLIYNLSVPTSIIQCIVERFLCGIKWDIKFNNKCLSLLRHEDDSKTIDSISDIYNTNNLFEYDLKHSLISYPYEIIDALHIPTTFEINLSEYYNRNYQFIFHINMTKKGDESWIGFMEKDTFKSLCKYSDKLNDNICILYYGGRERSIDTRLSINIDILKQLFEGNINNINDPQIEHSLMTYLNRDGHGCIYSYGKSIMDKIQPFRTGDWISICIENNIITFYNNGILIYKYNLNQKNNKLYNKDLILFSLV
eukprot:226231_1